MEKTAAFSISLGILAPHPEWVPNVQEFIVRNEIVMMRFPSRAVFPVAALAALLTVFACSGESQAPEVTGPVTVAPPQEETRAVEEAQRWRQDRLQRLTAEDGWLTLIGLNWLEPGGNAIGSAADSAIPLPEKFPSHLGTIRLAEAEDFSEEVVLEFIPASQSRVMVGDRVVRQPIPLRTDREESPTILQSDSVSFFVIERGDRYGVRVRDKDAPTRQEFRGLEYFDYDPHWRVRARLETHDPPKTIPIADVTGSVQNEISPGTVVFDVDGRTDRLDALDGGPDELFLIFSDETSGKSTYGAGRYLYVPRPDSSGSLVVDFNKSYNPPCAFTDFATCPLPPPQNRLPLVIEAGERKYGAHENESPDHDESDPESSPPA